MLELFSTPEVPGYTKSSTRQPMCLRLPEPLFATPTAIRSPHLAKLTDLCIVPALQLASKR